jgi:glutathione S-transferase
MTPSVPPLHLLFANRNYSSWSMRPWVLLTELGLPFTEHVVRLFTTGGADDPFYAAVARWSPAARVPVLWIGARPPSPGDAGEGFAVWDSLAIAEALHERFPQAGVWPDDARARARARSVCAEMHAGFGALRTHCPMNIEAALPEAGARVLREQPAVARDLARIDAMWCEALAESGGRGGMLFGAFSAADAFYAPVVMRVRTYGLPLSAPAAAYAERLAARPAVARWIAAALEEHDFIADDEPYRTAPAR